MAQSDLDIIVGADTRNLNRNVNTAVRKLERKGVNLDTKKGQMALGRITGKADEFTKSLEASNARVIAFGASVAVIEGVRRSFTKLVSTIVEVESQLTAINSILGQSSGTISKFGNELFDIAKKTGQSFQTVAQTAQEFARQGLAVGETLKRTEDSLILVRLTTLKTNEAVAAITATLNGFAKEALTSTEVINKLRAVETSFAVSSDDLAAALARSAAVAQGAGVSFNELLGVITAMKQRTGLGGATLGQGLKTAFTRLSLPNRIAELKDLKVAIDDNSSGMEKLRQVSIAYKAAQDAGNQSLAAQIGQVAAGGFQISKLISAFQDLSSAYSVADSAALKSGEATNEANKANEEYNQTIGGISKQINSNIGKIFNSVGALGTGDAIKDLVGNINSILEAFQGNKLGASNAFIGLLNDAIIGAKNFGFLRDAAEGFAKVLSGPGLVAAAAVVKNLFANTLVQGGASLLSLTGLNKGQKNREQTQTATVALLKQGTEEEKKQFALATSQAQKEQVILGILERQLAIQKAQERSEVRFSEHLRKRGLIISGSAGGYNIKRSTKAIALNRGVSNNAGGTIPEAIIREQNAIGRNVGGATSKAQARVIEKFNYGRGKKGPAVVNSEELIIPNKSGDIVLNKEMMKGGMMNKSTFNYAAGSKREIAIKGKLENGLPLTVKDKEWLRKNAGTNPGGASSRNQNKILPATASAIIKRGGNSIYADNTIGSVRTNRFKERSQGVNPVGRPTAKEATKRNLINKGASGAFENLRSSSFIGPPRGSPTGADNFGEFARRQDSLDNADRIAQEREAKKRRALEAQKIREQELRREKALQRRDIEEDVRRQDQTSRFQGATPVNANTRFSQADRSMVLNDEYRSELKTQMGRRGMSMKDLNSTPEGKKLRQQVRTAVKTSVGNRFFEIDQQIAEQQVKGAQAAIDKQSRKGIGGRLGMPSFRGIEKRFEQDKTMTPMAKKMIKADISNRRFQRNQGIAQRGFLGSMVLSMSAPTIGRGAEFIAGKAGQDEDAAKRTGNIFEGAAQGASTGMSAGSLFGLPAMIAGTVGGAILGGVSSAGKKESPSDILAAQFDKLQETNANSANAIKSFLQSQSLISDLISSGDLDQQKILGIEDATNKTLRESGLTSEQIEKLTSATSNDRGDVAVELQRQLNSQTFEAKNRLDVTKILEDTTGSRVVQTDFSRNREKMIMNLARNGQGQGASGLSMLEGFDKLLSKMGMSSNSFIVEDDPFSDISEDQKKELKNINLSNVDFSAMDQAMKNSGDSIGEFSKSISEGLSSGRFGGIQKALMRLGIDIDDLPSAIRESSDALHEYGNIISESFKSGGGFQDMANRRSMTRTRVGLGINSAAFGRAQMENFNVQRSINNASSFRDQLSGPTEINRERSALLMSGSRFGLTGSGRDDNFNKIQALKVKEEEVLTGTNKNKIFDDTIGGIDELINPIVTSGTSFDEEKLTPVLAKMATGISSLEELNNIRTELKNIFSGTEGVETTLNSLVLSAAESLELEKIASNDRRENINISNNQEAILRKLRTDQSVRSQQGSEMGMSVSEVMGRDDPTIAGKVRAQGEYTSTKGVKKVLTNEAGEIREGFVAALEEKDEDGKFKIDRFTQASMLSEFDRNIKNTGTEVDENGQFKFNKYDVAGRANEAIRRMGEGQYGSRMETAGFGVLTNEITSRGKTNDALIASTPSSVREAFTERKDVVNRDAGLSGLVVPQNKEQARLRDQYIKEYSRIQNNNNLGRYDGPKSFHTKSGMETTERHQIDQSAIFNNPFKNAYSERGMFNHGTEMYDQIFNSSVLESGDFDIKSGMPLDFNKNNARLGYGAASMAPVGVDLDDPRENYMFSQSQGKSDNAAFRSMMGLPNLIEGGDANAYQYGTDSAVKDTKPAPEETTNPLIEELKKTNTALSALAESKNNTDFLTEILRSLEQGKSDKTITGDEMGTAIKAIDDFKSSDKTQGDRGNLEAVIQKLVENQEITFSELLEQIKQDKQNSNVEQLADLNQNIATFITTLNEGVESKVETFNNFTLSFDGVEENFANTEAMIESMRTRLEGLEASLRGDVVAPA
jgi:TP901 family phage tail tape measure protein